MVGKGYMKIVFDHIGMPNMDEQLEAKIVAAQGQKVDRQGDILGKGHAKRDVAEWMLPPLWPWKVMMLPARGPEPKLKAEEVITLRLMQDIEVPQFTTESTLRAGMAPIRAAGRKCLAPTPILRSARSGPTKREGSREHLPQNEPIRCPCRAVCRSRPAIAGGVLHDRLLDRWWTNPFRAARWPAGIR